MTTPIWTYHYGEPLFSQQNVINIAVTLGQFGPAHRHSISLGAANDRIVFHGDFVVHNGLIASGTVHGFNVFDDGSKIMTATGYTVSFSHLHNLISHTDASTATADLPLLSLYPTLTQFGSADADRFFGSTTSHNFMFGRAGGDWLMGGSHHDVLNGGSGADYLQGMFGPDTLIGGVGNDTFVFFDRASIDTIKDFKPGHDHIGLDDTAFTGMPDGDLQGAQFHIGTHATAADQHIIYTAATGALYYDSDGLGGVGQVKFAQLSPYLHLHASDFLVTDFH